MSYSGIRLDVWTNLEEEVAHQHTLHTKCEKQCNLHVTGSMIGRKLYHTQAYECLCVRILRKKRHTRILCILNVKRCVFCW